MNDDEVQINNKRKKNHVSMRHFDDGWETLGTLESKFTRVNMIWSDIVFFLTVDFF